MVGGANFEKAQFRFDGSLGIWLAGPADAVPEGFYPVLENWRPEADGSITPRAGQGAGSPLLGGQTNLHSARRLNDSSSGPLQSTIIVGSGGQVGRVSTDLGAATSASLGFSGDPLSIAIDKPGQSVKPYAYVADRNKMIKIDQAGNTKGIGISAPASPPSAVLGLPQFKFIDDFTDSTLWTAGGNASGLVNSGRVSTAVKQIIYDGPVPNWACIEPDSMENIVEGAVIKIAGILETVKVQKVFRGSMATTVSDILYESGAHGLCSIHLYSPIEEIEVDSMVFLNGTEFVRVLSVHRTPDGFTSFRCSTVGTISVGSSAQAVASFRVLTVFNHAIGNGITDTSSQFQVTAGAPGYITRSGFFDFSLITSSLITRNDDFISIGLWVDKPDLITEIKVLADCDATTNDFTQNYYFHSIRQNDLVPVTTDSQTVVDNIKTQINRNIIDAIARNRRRIPITVVGPDFGTPSSPDPYQFDNPSNSPNQPEPPGNNQTSAGKSQWVQVRFRVSEFVAPDLGRVGSDSSRGLKDIVAIRVSVVSTGTVNVRVADWYIMGGSGPDSTNGARGRRYRYRGRDKTTGVVGNWSPATPNEVFPVRQVVFVNLAGLAGDATRLDIEVYGGQLLGWYYLGSVDNPGNGFSTSFIDTMSDLELSFRSAISEQANTHYRLWPSKRPPISGTHAYAAGPYVNLVGGDAIDDNTAPGTAIRIGDKEYIIDRVLGGTRFYLTESAGGQQNVSWEIAEPLVNNNSFRGLSVSSFYGYRFGWGDPYNPGRVYYTNYQDYDSAGADNYIDIGSPSEPVQHVLILPEGRAICWTSERCFTIEPAFSASQSGGDVFTYRQISGYGMITPWMCCVAGNWAVFGSKYGIYKTAGGDATCISDDIAQLFPHKGVPGVAVDSNISGITYRPPAFTTASSTKFRLGFVDGEVFFDYVDTIGNGRTLVYTGVDSVGKGAWRPYQYAVPPNFHYAEEGDDVHGCLLGGSDGKLYRLAVDQADSGGAGIVASMQCPHKNLGDAVMRKYLAECVLAYDTDGATITYQIGVDNYSQISPPVNITDPAGRTQRPLDILSGVGIFGRNISLSITTTVTTERPVLYLWQVAYQLRPDTTLLRAADYDLVSGQGVKYVRGVWIHADTAGATRSALLEYTKDDGTISSTQINGISHSVMCEVFYPLAIPVYLTSSRLRPLDAASWDYRGYRLEADPAPPKKAEYTEWLPAGKGIGAYWVQGVKCDVDTEGANVGLQVEVDGGVFQTSIVAGSNGGPLNSAARAVLPFSFDQPFITHLIRFLPINGTLRNFGIEVISEPEPDLARMWWAQQSDCGVQGYKVFGDGFIGLRSTGEVTLEFIVDGVTVTAVFHELSTNTNGQRRMFRFRLPTIKGKNIQPRAYTQDVTKRLALYEKEFGLEYKPWAYEGSWQKINLLGDLHYESGARL